MNKLSGWELFCFNRILLANINIYPLNIFFHGFGVVLWTAFAFLGKDKAIMTNFFKFQFLHSVLQTTFSRL